MFQRVFVTFLLTLLLLLTDPTNGSGSLTQILGDAAVVQDVGHVGVDVREVLEAHQLPQAGRTRPFVELDEDLLFGQGGRSQLYSVLLQNLVDVVALHHREQLLLYHQHRQENRTGPNDVRERTAVLHNVLLEPLEEIPKRRLDFLVEPENPGGRSQQTRQSLQFGVGRRRLGEVQLRQPGPERLL